MLVRTTLPLMITFANDGEPIEGRTRFQKMIFLLLMRAEFFKNRYDFEPHDYGPYSKELQSDIDHLIKEGYVSEKRKTREEGKIKYAYSITKEGAAFVNHIISDEGLNRKFQFSNILELSNKVKGELNHKDLSLLLYEIYDEYPKYAKYSKFQY